VIIREAQPQEWEAITRAQADSWLATYPNDEYGISFDLIKQFTDSWFVRNSTPEGNARFTEMLAHPRTIYRVAEINGEIVGLVVLYRGADDGEANLSAIYVTPTMFSKGIGQALLDTALSELGDKPIRVTVAPYNQRAIAFYHRNGFEDVADSEGTYRIDGGSIPTIDLVRPHKKL
jgi:ribosomal protein S18 acetylase RimI-like enzyme